MPRILRVVDSRSLQCGCFVGVYETYIGATVEIVEERDPRCPDPSHHEGQVTRQVNRQDNGRHQHVAA